MKNHKIVAFSVLLFLGPFKFAEAVVRNQCGYDVQETARKSEVIFNIKDQKAMGFLDTGAGSEKLNSLGDQMVATIKANLDGMIRSELQAAPEYESSSVGVSGPFQFSISGSPGSNNAVSSLSMGSISISASFSKRKYVLGIVRVSARCSLNVSMRNPRLVGSYDLINNRMSFSQGTSLNLEHSQNCSSSLGWIPVIGSFIDRTITSKVGSFLNSKISEFTQRAINASYTPGDFGGLMAALPDGKFVRSGFDLGRALRTNIIDLFQHNNVTIVISPRSTQRNILSSQSVSDELFSISFNNSRIKLSTLETRNYEMVWRQARGCAEP